MAPDAPRLTAIMGPTASGKTALAEALADRTGARLINADAFQVYRGLDIGTAKPERRDLYDLLDLVGPEEGFGVGEWIQRALPILDDLHRAGRDAILVGGTGYYVRALLDGYDRLFPAPDPALRAELMRREAEEGLPALADELARIAPDESARIDRHNPVRVRRALERAIGGQQPIRFELPPFTVRKIGLWIDPPQLDARIAERTRELFARGWETEVAHLIRSEVPPDAPGMRAIGYKIVSDLLAGRLEPSAAFAAVDQETRRYAKRQRTWLRGESSLIWIGSSSSSCPTGALAPHVEALLLRGA